MRFFRSLHAKVLFAAFVPGILVLAVVAILGLFAYERTARVLVEQRDAELARISALRLRNGLDQHTSILKAISDDVFVQTLDLDGVRLALDRAESQIQDFDGGVAIYSDEGITVWSSRFSERRQEEQFSLRSELENVRASQQISFSNIFFDSVTGKEAILITAPIISRTKGFTGVVAGIATIDDSLLSAMYSDALDVRPSPDGFAYLVDGNGKAIFHRQSGFIGDDFSDLSPVASVITGDYGVLISDDRAGQTVLSAFAPVPGTNWGVVTQERWANVVGPIRTTSLQVIGLLALGGLAAIGGVSFFIGRTLRPIRDLNQGARRIASGDFDYTIDADTGDEVEELAQQFNIMASALRMSYTELEDRVALRTRELRESEERMRAVMTGAPVTILALDREGTFTLSEGQGLQAFGIGPDAWQGESVLSDHHRRGPDVSDEFHRALAGEEIISTINWEGMTYDTRYSPLRDDEGEIQGVIIIGTDITERVQAEEAARALANENSVMAEIGRIVGSSLEISQVYDRFAEQAQNLLPFDAVTVILVDPDRQTFTLSYMSGLTVQERQPGMEYPLDGTATVEAYNSLEPILFQPQSRDEVAERYPGLVPAYDEGILSFLIAPLISNNQAIGVLFFNSVTADKYTEEDLQMTQRVAAQIAGAVANSQLYEARTRAEEQLRASLEENQQLYQQEQRRAEQLAVINEVGRQVTSTLELGQVLRGVGDLISESLGYKIAAIGMIEGDELVFGDDLNPFLMEPVRRSISSAEAEMSITAWVAHTGQPLLTPDVLKEPRYIAIEQLSDIRSELAVPIMASGQPVGVLDVESDRVNAFDETDLSVLQSLAQQLGIAVENAQLFQAEQRRAEQFRIIGELSSQMSSYLEMDEVLSQTVELIQRTFDYYHVGIGLIENDEVVYKFGAGDLSDNPEFSYEPRPVKVGQEGIVGQVAATGEAVLTSNVNLDPNYNPMSPSETRSELYLPIRVRGQVIGILELQSDQLNAFDESDVVTLQSLASEAGIAIENARIFEAERRRNDQMQAINTMAVNISSVLTLDELLPYAARLVYDTFDYQIVSIFLVDEDTQEVVIQASEGFPEGGKPAEPGFKVPFGQGIIGNAARTGETRLVNDTSENDDYYYEGNWSNIKSELSIPIKQGDEVVGVLDLQSTRLDAFDETDVATIETLANQLAVAMENARLFDESRDLAVLEERNRMAREIHDTLAQGFTGIVLQLEAGEQALEEEDPTELRRHLTIAKNLAREGLSEARRSVWNLLPQALEENPLHVALSDEVERFNAVESQQATFEIIGARRQLPPVLQAALLRICQESLTNIRKYAEATQVSVKLTFGRDNVGVSIVDNGKGFDPANVNIGEGRGGFGLTAMRQRARLLRGDITITSAPGQGTRVETTIPIG